MVSDSPSIPRRCPTEVDIVPDGIGISSTSAPSSAIRKVETALTSPVESPKLHSRRLA